MFQAEIERLKLEIEKAPRGGPFFLGEEHQYHQFRLKINDGQKMSKMMLYVEASKNIQYILVMYVLVHCCEHVLIWGISLPASALIMVILTTNMDLPLFIDG